MEEVDDAVKEKFWDAFKRVLDVDDCDAELRQENTEEWDSLKHVELIFELEEAFDIDVAPDDIADLYSDTNTVLSYLQRQIDSQH